MNNLMKIKELDQAQLTEVDNIQVKDLFLLVITFRNL
jgi:hypothetical protein